MDGKVDHPDIRQASSAPLIGIVIATMNAARTLPRCLSSIRAQSFRGVYGRVRQLDSDERLIQQLGEPWQSFKSRVRSYACLPHLGLMHHRSLFEINGRFDERFKLAADYEFLLREVKAGEALFVPVVTVLRETEHALRMHGLSPPGFIWRYWKFLAQLYVRLYALAGDRVARRLADVYRVISLRKPRYSASDRLNLQGPAD